MSVAALSGKVYHRGLSACRCGSPVCDPCQRMMRHQQARLTIGKLNLARAQVREASERPSGRYTAFRKPL